MPSEKDYNGFRLEIDETAVLTFNQSRVNIFSTKVLNEFIGALKRLYSEKKVKVLVITGEGKTFLAGADIKEMSSFTPGEAMGFSMLFHEAMDFVKDYPNPVIAAVNGFALGGGCELTLVCDMVIASDKAFFGQPEINLGIIPGAGGTQRLAERIGKMRAKELIFTGRKVSADEALSIGLVNRVVPGERLLEEAMKTARHLASRPSHTLKVCKALVDSGSLSEEIEMFSRMFSHDDRKRLMREFIKGK